MRSERQRPAGRGCAIACAAVLCVVLQAGSARGDPVRLESEASEGGARVTLIWPEPVAFTTQTSAGRLSLHFERPAEGDLGTLAALRRFVGAPTTTDGGKTIHFPLKRGVTALAWPAESTVVVQFAAPDPPKPAATEETAAPSIATEGPPKVPVRTGQHRGYSRVVFDWTGPVGYAIERTPGAVSVVFDRPAEIDVRQLRPRYLEYVRGGSVDRQGDSTRVTLQIDDTSRVRDRRDGRKVVIDVLTPAPGVASPAGTTAPAPAGGTNPPPAVPPTPPPAPVPQKAAPAAVAPIPSVPSPPALPEAATRAERQVKPTLLRIPWEKSVAAAVFRRGSAVWCVFDQASTRDTTALAREAGGVITRIEQRPHERATVLRVETSVDVYPKMERDGLNWLIRLVGTPPIQGEAIFPVPEVADAGAARLLLPVADPGEPLAVADPVARETMVVVPVIPLATRMERAWAYPQFRLPETAQGIVIQPAIDTLRVRSVPDGVEITTPDGLALSPAATEPPDGAGAERLLDPRDWKGPQVAGFVAKRQALERAAADAPADQREEHRLRLAQFLLANRFSVEALGVLQVAVTDRPALATDPAFLVLRGGSALMAGRLRDAGDDLARAATAGSAEARMWAAASRAAAGEPAADLAELPKWGAIVQRYPVELRAPLATWLAEAAIDGNRPHDAQRLIEVAKAASSGNEARGRLAYLDGRRRQATGDVEGALTAFEEAGRLDPRRARAEAELARTRLLLQQKRITPAEAIATLEGLRFAWRGDEVEFRVLRELGRLALQAEDYPNGLRALKYAIGDFPKLPEAQEATREMVQAFERLYIGGAADKMPPVMALGLYEEFKELTPPGETGRTMVRKLADRLAAVDLLDRAAGLLDGLLASTDAPAERAAIGARLAELRLLDDDAAGAIDALRRTGAGAYPAELQRKRAMLEARALAGAGRDDEALAVLGRDDTLDADLLRAKILRRKGDWARAAGVMRRILDATRGSQAAGTLDERQARDVLDLAVALTLAGSDPQLAQLDEEFNRAMATTPLKDAFRLLAGTIPPPDADPATLADLVERAMAFRRSLPPAGDAVAP